MSATGENVRSDCSSSNRGECGMTLLETLVAVAVLALISALGFPALDTMRQRAMVRQAASQVASDLGRMRASAILTEAVRGIAIMPEGQTYYADGAVRQTPDGIRLAGEGIRFFSDGTALGTDIAVAGRGGRVVISYDPALGIVLRDGAR